MVHVVAISRCPCQVTQRVLSVVTGAMRAYVSGEIVQESCADDTLDALRCECKRSLGNVDNLEGIVDIIRSRRANQGLKLI